MFLKIVLAFIFSVSVFAQQNKKPFPYRVESNLWIKNYRNLQTDSERLSFIKSKIYSDTLYYNYKKRIFLDNPRNPEKHICKSLFFLKSKNEFIDLDLQQNPKLLDFIKNLNLRKIKSIKLIEFPQNVIAFGDDAVCGLIYLECSEQFMKKLKTSIK